MVARSPRYGHSKWNPDLYYMPNRRLINLLCWVTLLGFTGLGELILQWKQDRSLLDLLHQGWAWYWQIVLGAVVGWAGGMLAKWIIAARFMAAVRVEYLSMIRQLRLRKAEVLFLSFCAGFGEECLFRGAVQPWLGIWLTAIVFVAIHGYLNPLDWRISVYGGIMVFFIALLGYLFEQVGPFTAITAHFLFDVLLLWQPSQQRLQPFDSTTPTPNLLDDWKEIKPPELPSEDDLKKN